jgi:outer membrane biosynthesis protein TonB
MDMEAKKSKTVNPALVEALAVDAAALGQPEMESHHYFRVRTAKGDVKTVCVSVGVGNRAKTHTLTRIQRITGALPVPKVLDMVDKAQAASLASEEAKALAEAPQAVEGSAEGLPGEEAGEEPEVEKTEAPKAEEPKAEEPKAEEPKAEEPKAEEPKVEKTEEPAKPKASHKKKK